MENIFEGAKFGDKFVTRDGRIAVFKQNILEDCVWVFTEIDFYSVHLDGKVDVDLEHNGDIVSKYQEPIDEEKLDELAKESKNFIKMLCSDMHVFEMATTYEAGFINGYRKAMEEK